MKVVITGFAGFIGSNFTKYVLQNQPDWQVYGLDGYTYAARPEYLFNWTKDNISNDRFMALKLDIRDEKEVQQAIDSIQPDAVFHLAAESHVCSSLKTPRDFIHSNILGTWNVIEACRKLWDGDGTKIFQHISTDEVFGQLKEGDLPFTEQHQIDPRSPYAASKAASDHIVSAYSNCYNMNTRITNCTNNFGFNQHEEKLIPRTILKLLAGESMTIYGTGKQVRDWIWVDDHSEALLKVYSNGLNGQRYCIGGNAELSNMEMIELISIMMQEDISDKIKLNLTFTNDRPHDDFRYAVDTSKVEKLGWKPRPDLFKEQLRKTIIWYAAQYELQKVRG